MEENIKRKTIWLDPKKVQDRPVYFTCKRIFDIIASSLGLILLSPLFLVLSILIKCDGSHGKVFYTQERVGCNGDIFKMYKFRSMIPNADQKLAELKKFNEVDGAMFKMKDDPRVTRVGRFIRKYSLDELPQLVNVLIGEMSLVGPRPPLPKEVAEYTEYDRQRLLVKPGCTGLWQVTGRNNVGFDDMVYLDIVYIMNSGFWFDLKIICKTVQIMVVPNAAY
ncbi:sugar transferase [Fructilactobacillus fructivorans]|uniref:Undecaprenyl-phosphate galactosephosphotransferase n=1 Tax=Fructilactobacillus fructivorans TaxID=1614 RepID=A0A0C1LZJ4_9LACO|nr:sugar transferase [Fructilactobacillus fructivorans]KID42295.1 Undecaprenyl-phosphate galactosephosphotransferase [Fructilactobacillus fructivorans]MCT0151085.1 sugar transferase [Fructilactobacillus fructivorans]MCT2867357.1 sugar transferase [Fructilactobacillus fructivorans]MCT2869124.1 sugar transferase [Fructilactobacillus fructivorans]MCT2873156.1 sugar transferase [Fructilactobacillus fructivorans]